VSRRDRILAGIVSGAPGRFFALVVDFVAAVAAAAGSRLRGR